MKRAIRGLIRLFRFLCKEFIRPSSTAQGAEPRKKRNNHRPPGIIGLIARGFQAPQLSSIRRIAAIRPSPRVAGPHVELAGIGSAFAPDYHPAEIFEMAQKLYRKAKG